MTDLELIEKALRDAKRCEPSCKSYSLVAKDGRKITLTIHCHVRHEYWYEVVVPNACGGFVTTRVCSEYQWTNPAHALAAAMARFTEIDKPSGEKWDDRTIPGATRRTGTT